MSKIILRDGSIAELRKINDNKRDREQLKNLFNEASKESLYNRFFIPIKEVTNGLIDEMIQTDEKKGLSLVCEIKEKIIAIGTYIKTKEAGVAEVSFFVNDKYQGLGIGSILLTHLGYIAWVNGFNLFEAYVMPENKKMIYVFIKSGFEVKQQWESGEIKLSLSLYERERVNAINETREKFATAASLTPFFKPKKILLIEDENNKNNYPLIHKNISNSNFKGEIKTSLEGMVLKEEFDVAIVNLPIDKIINLIVSTTIKTKSLIMMGFYHDFNINNYKDTDRLLLDILRKKGIRIIGPYSLGIINNAPECPLNASYLPKVPQCGTISIASHSGALGLYLVRYLDSIGIGIKDFVSLGNKIDVSGNDLLQYWEDDIKTETIVLYLESFGNPEKFTRLCRRISRIKPILVVKSARNPLSAAISKQKKVELALDDYTVSNLFKQAGIIKVETTNELFDTIKLLYSNSIPENCHIAIISNTLEGSIVLTDSLSDKGLTNIENPIILSLKAQNDIYISELKKILNNNEINIVLIVFMTLFDDNNSVDLIKLFKEELKSLEITKLIILCILDSDKKLPEFIPINGGKQKIPLYFSIDKATRALSHVINYSEYVKKPKGNVPDIKEFNTKSIRKFIKNILDTVNHSTQGITLNKEQVEKLIRYMNLNILETHNKNIIAKLSIFIVKDPYFGPLIGLYLYRETDEEIDSLSLDMFKNKDVSIIRLTPLTDVEVEDVINNLLKNHTPDIILKDNLKSLLLKIAILPREVPEINKIVIPNILLYKDAFELGNITVQLIKPKSEL
jgi:succinyl-CoA synthetase alpha subunit/RimJ/RimL family protein N-acetyltransferase